MRRFHDQSTLAKLCNTLVRANWSPLSVEYRLRRPAPYALSLTQRGILKGTTRVAPSLAGLQDLYGTGSPLDRAQRSKCTTGSTLGPHTWMAP
jgi:hypothetical protein